MEKNKKEKKNCKKKTEKLNSYLRYMSILDRVHQDYTQALKSGNSIKVDILRILRSSLQNAQIQKGHENPLSDSEQQKIIQSEVKKLKDAMEQYEKAGRSELAEREKNQLDVVMKYMPKQLSEDEVRTIVKEVMKESGAENKSQMGVVMGTVMGKISGKADGSVVKEIVMEELK